MPRFHINTLTAALLAITLSQPIAQAEILTYGFSGVIDEVQNSTDLPVEDAFSLGTSWEVTYRFEIDNPIERIVPDEPFWWYRFNHDSASAGRVFEMIVTLGGQTYEQIVTPNGRRGNIIFWDDVDRYDFSGGPDDRYGVAGYFFPDIEEIEIQRIGVVLHGDAAAHDGMPIDLQPEMSRYYASRFSLLSPGYAVNWPINTYGIFGRVDRFFVVPEPGTALLLAIAALSMIRRCRRH